MTNGRLRTVVREPRFEEQLNEIESSVRRMDEALQYVEERLASSPDSGIPTSVPGLWVAPVRVPSEGALIRASIFYTFTEDYVVLRAIRRAP